jgi:hypothetical protein
VKEFNIILRRLLALTVVAMLITLVACTSVPAPTPPPETTAEPPVPEETPVVEPASRLTPSELVPRISIEELLGKMESNASIVIVDTRHKEEYDVDHIKGAVSAPLADIVGGKWFPPPGKETILYCG